MPDCWIYGRFVQHDANPHFSQAFYYGVGYGHVYSVALGRAPRHTVKYACGAQGACPGIKRDRVPSAEGPDARRRAAGDVFAHRRGAATKQMAPRHSERGPF